MADTDIFADRTEAGRLLGAVVAEHVRRAGHTGGSWGRPLVLALPRGGVPVGLEVARAIHGELDVAVARKIGLPWQPELGVGAVTVDGPPVWNTDLLDRVGLTAPDLAPAVTAERDEGRRRLRRYRGNRPAPVVTGRVAVVVDDGVATGITARAALRDLRRRDPAHMIFAVPVCAPKAADGLAIETDEVICLRSPANFAAVGYWYAHFPQLTDDQVERLLDQARMRGPDPDRVAVGDRRLP